MKHFSNLRSTFIALALALGSLQSVKAQTTVSYDSSLFGFDSVTTFLNNSGTASNLYTGLFNVDLGIGGTYTTVCMQPDVYLQNGATYDIYNLNTSPLNSVVASRAAFIVDNFYAEVTDLDRSVGFQLAMWEIAKDGAGIPDFTTGQFIYDTSTATAAANAFANILLTASYDTTSSVKFLDGPNSQDLIAFGLSTPAVPEPAGSVLVVLAGMIGLLRRRR
jgi:hypothetical protein